MLENMHLSKQLSSAEGAETLAIDDFRQVLFLSANLFSSRSCGPDVGRSYTTKVS